MRRFFAHPDQISQPYATLAADEAHHLRDVLRLKVGDQVDVFDGSGNEYTCIIRSIAKNGAELEILNPVTPASPESPLDLTMAVAVLKGDKFDLVVQKLVELGVNTIVPLITSRTEADQRGVRKRLERWRRIALEATKQCGRARLVRITEQQFFKDLISQPRTSLVMFAEREGASFQSITEAAAMTAIVGPEGGWADNELQSAREAEASIVTLGGRILRAETAAIAVAAVLQHRFGDIN